MTAACVATSGKVGQEREAPMRYRYYLACSADVDQSSIDCTLAMSNGRYSGSGS